MGCGSVDIRGRRGRAHVGLEDDGFDTIGVAGEDREAKGLLAGAVASERLWDS